MNRDYGHLSSYIDSLQSKGNYFLYKGSAIRDLGLTDVALRSSIKRQVKKQRLVQLKKGLYLIVPLEYRNMGAPPAEWYIDTLMKEYGAKYYVGLLTAAASHGAAHQQPQIYQIITNKVLRPLKIGRVRIRFYFKKDFVGLPLTQVNTPTGYMTISSPELTTFDLVRYLKQSGHIHHVSTVIAELGEKLDPKMLFDVAVYFPQACIQRLGYILDFLGYSNKTQELLKRVSLRYYPLRADKKWSRYSKNDRWRLFLNEELETDI